MNNSVKEVKALENNYLKLAFSDGKQKIFDVSPYLNLPVFKPLKNNTLFKSVKIEFDTVSWPNEIDFDPAFLYENGKDIL